MKMKKLFAIVYTDFGCTALYSLTDDLEEVHRPLCASVRPTSTYLQRPEAPRKTGLFDMTECCQSTGSRIMTGDFKA